MNSNFIIKITQQVASCIEIQNRQSKQENIQSFRFNISKFAVFAKNVAFTSTEQFATFQLELSLDFNNKAFILEIGNF